MLSKVVFFVVLASLGIAHGARMIANPDKDIVPVGREGRLLEIPIIGTVLLKSLKIACFLMSTAWSFIGYKLSAALALVANALFWVFHNGFSIILGAAAMLIFW